VNGRAATKRYIFETLYHDRTPDEWPDVKCLDQYVAKIRRKLPADQAARLVTVWGIGWRWISEKENPAP
jgi:DNA-binding response OmpR family regulator